MASNPLSKQKKKVQRGKSMFSKDKEESQSELAKTKVLVTINPNKSAKTVQKYQELRDTLIDILKDLEQNDIEQVTGTEPYVKKISTKNLGIEIGSKYKRVHAHFILSIKHYVEHYSIKKLRERLKDWLDENGRALSKNWYVNLKIINAYEENYANKEARKAAAIARENEDPDELNRLSDPRQEQNFHVRARNLKVLDRKQVPHMMVTGKRSYNK